MPSPFPGMDPYLEGYLWPDVHQALDTVYDEADYSLTLNYDEPPADPALPEGDAAWAREQVRSQRDLHKDGE